MVRQLFSLALFFRAFFGGGSFSNKDEHFMAARIGVACVVKSASRVRPAEQAHHAIAGDDAIAWCMSVGHLGAMIIGEHVAGMSSGAVFNE